MILTAVGQTVVPAPKPSVLGPVSSSIIIRRVEPLHLCGHARIRLVTLRPFLFALLSIALTQPLLGAATEADEMAGAVLFRDKGCAHCHGVGGMGTQKAPSLVGIRNNKQWTPEKITQQILNGGKKMPPFADSLSDPEIAQIVAYLRAKHRPVPPAVPSN
jgi:mono/diheme cytochrome c family protein